jgi:predicted  nucleic acid-binding Zn-ribbon protein
MANPIINKTVTQAALPKQDLQQAEIQKAGESKFDQIRARMQEASVQMPPEVTQISAEQKRLLESNLRKQLEVNRPDQITRQISQELGQTRSSIHDLQHKVNALPKAAEFDPVRNRLQSIEAQYAKSEELMKGLSGVKDPRALLQVQMQMLQLSQNVEIVGKVVEQVNTGVKSILQTQV